MINEFIDRQAVDEDLYELEDVQTGEKRQYRIVSKATVTQEGTALSKATFDPILEKINDKLSKSGDAMTGQLVAPQLLPPEFAESSYVGSSTFRYGGMYGGYGSFLNLESIGGTDLGGDTRLLGDIYPDTNGLRNLGKADNRFSTAYAIHGNFSGSVVTNNAYVNETLSADTGEFSAIKLNGYPVWYKGNLTVESGTFDPYLCVSSGTPLAKVGYTSRYGVYSRVGSMVTVSFKIQLSSSAETKDTRVYIGPLPFAPNLSNNDCDLPVRMLNINTSYTNGMLRLYHNGVTAALQIANISGADLALNGEHLKTSTGISGSFSYTCLD